MGHREISRRTVWLEHAKGALVLGASGIGTPGLPVTPSQDQPVVRCLELLPAFLQDIDAGAQIADGGGGLAVALMVVSDPAEDLRVLERVLDVGQHPLQDRHCFTEGQRMLRLLGAPQADRHRLGETRRAEQVVGEIDRPGRLVFCEDVRGAGVDRLPPRCDDLRVDRLLRERVPPRVSTRMAGSSSISCWAIAASRASWTVAAGSPETASSVWASKLRPSAAAASSTAERSSPSRWTRSRIACRTDSGSRAFPTATRSGPSPDPELSTTSRSISSRTKGFPSVRSSISS